MWFSKPEEPTAKEKWHSKALMVDPRKTRITIIRGAVQKKCETETLNVKAAVPNVIAVKTLQTAEEDYLPVDSTLEMGQNLKTTKANLETIESNVTETPDFDEPAENLETTEPNFELVKPNAAETLSANETSGDREVFEPRSRSKSSDVAEEQYGWESLEELVNMEKELRIVELNLPEASNTIASINNSGMVDSDGTKVAKTYGISDYACELMPTEDEPLNVKFLRALEKTRSKWYDDKQFAKIVQKMEKGKNLKRKEFDKVYLHIYTYCQYH